jgi:geranylgeranyl pyrophosphate synthase
MRSVVLVTDLRQREQRNNINMAVFSVVAPCRAQMMEAVSTSETSVNFYQTTGATTQKTAILIIAAVRT